MKLELTNEQVKAVQHALLIIGELAIYDEIAEQTGIRVLDQVKEPRR